MTFEQTITNMGILSDEVYNDKYLEYKIVNGKKEYTNAFIPRSQAPAWERI